MPIIPAVHGTSMEIAWKIVQNGFSNLSILDAGYYGRGIYTLSTVIVYIIR